MDGFDAALRQLAEHGERLALLDAREAEHFTAIGERLAELSSLVTGLGSAVRDQAAIPAALQGLDEQVAVLTSRLAGLLPEDGDGEPRSYQPSPTPRWWKLRGHGREQALERLAGWVEQVYRPGYGHLAAGLGECWEQHPLCLYIVDWLSELWSVLYLAPARTPGTLAGQAEWHTRLLAAAAEQLARETRGCAHGTSRHRTATLGVRP